MGDGCLDCKGQVIRFDPKSEQIIARVQVSGSLDAIAGGEGTVWVLDSILGVVTVIDPTTDKVSGSVWVGARPTDISVGLGAVWVTNQGDGTISRIDPVSLTVRTIAVGASVSAVAVDQSGGRLWVAISPPIPRLAQEHD